MSGNESEDELVLLFQLVVWFFFGFFSLSSFVCFGRCRTSIIIECFIVKLVPDFGGPYCGSTFRVV